MGMFKVTISGDYRTSGGVHGDIVDFDGVTGIMPECDEAWVQSHVMNRFVGIWLKADKRYPARFNSLRSVYVDGIERIKGTPSCIGKNIKELSWEELQELAVAKHLLRIPLIQATDIRTARETAYLEYSEKILGKKINVNNPEYSYAKLPALVVSSDGIADDEPTQTNEEAIAQAQEENKEFTLDELRKLAKDKGIEFHPRTGYAKLYSMVFPAG